VKIGGHPIDLVVAMGTEHSIVTHPVGPLSNKHTTIIGDTGDWVCHLFLLPCGPDEQGLVVQTEGTNNF
jgi:hypothetical protein